MQSQFVPKNQSLRFNRTANAEVAATTKKADAATAAALLSRRNALLQDYNKAHHKPAWSPAFNAAVRLLLIIRVASAMYSTIKDCDESFNYWEPLHLLIYPPSPAGNASSAAQLPFQTWEYSPQFAIRSWAYLAQYVPLARLMARLRVGKRQVFFSIRILLACTSTLIEARFYKAVAETFNARIGRYLLVTLAVSAGMFEASTALLPSSFAMYATMLAYSFWLYPPRLPSNDPSVLAFPNQRPFQPLRLVGAVTAFAAGAVVGWPFAIVLSAPFVLEQLFLRGDDVVPENRIVQWLTTRWSTSFGAATLAALVAVPVLVIDTLAYGRTTLVAFNIVRYNILSGARGAGPELYGVEPPSFYFANLLLNFNVLFPLALLAAPLLLVTALYDPKRLQRQPSDAQPAKGHTKRPEASSLLTLNALRVAPFYAWFILLTLQPHKEERFMYPAYPLLLMNAAISLYLIRSLLEVGYVQYTKSPYKASRSKLFTTTTATLLSATILLGTLRSIGQLSNYHAPFDVLFHLEGFELPRVVATLFPHTLNEDIRARIAKGLPAVPTQEERDYNERGKGPDNAGRSQDLSISLAPLAELPEPLRLCYGKEWHRFPTHFLVPFGVEVHFVQSEFRGILPKHFDPSPSSSPDPPAGDALATALDSSPLSTLWPRRWRDATRRVQDGFNDLNREEPDRYVPVSSCDYLVDLDNAHRYLSSSIVAPEREPRYAIDAQRWDRVVCKPFLDAEWSRPPSSSLWVKALAAVGRTLWLPRRWRLDANLYGDYCLLRNRESARVA